ncbi:MAG: hypothetical protein M1816_003406 [Peltula sp. TS41687]|nr:MAG: hypothetical protein M1816_003406 [Peltula sp. TS41687]
MNRIIPHPAYAEEQPLHHTILTTHVLHRGFQAGSIIGGVIGPMTYVLRRSATRSVFVPLVLQTTGVGAVLGTASMALALPLRMWGREEIEWRDRSWRLLENRGQNEVDRWSVAGALVGGLMAPWVVAQQRWRGAMRATAAATAATKLSRVARWRMGLGCSGLGSMVGVLGYMGWRYGVRGGKWPE